MKIKNFICFVLVGFFVLAISSCNRGLGCPGELSSEQNVEVSDIK